MNSMFENNILKYSFLVNHKLSGNGSHIYDEIPGCRWGWGGMANIYLNLKIFNFLNFYNLRAFFQFLVGGCSKSNVPVGIRLILILSLSRPAYFRGF